MTGLLGDVGELLEKPSPQISKIGFHTPRQKDGRSEKPGLFTEPAADQFTEQSLFGLPKITSVSHAQ